MKRTLGLFLLTLFTSLAWAKENKASSVTLSANIPHVLNLNYDLRLSPFFSIGVAGGYFGITYQSSEAGPLKFSTQNYEGHFRFHVFKGAFFLGMLLGSQTFSGETTRTFTISEIATSVDVTGSAKIQSYYVTPHLGWMWKWDSGFTFGFDLGYQIALSSSTTVSVPLADSIAAAASATTAYQDLLHDIEDVGNQLGKTGLPFITLLRFGWSF